MRWKETRREGRIHDEIMMEGTTEQHKETRRLGMKQGNKDKDKKRELF